MKYPKEEDDCWDFFNATWPHFPGQVALELSSPRRRGREIILSLI
jgi:hypothetical protein